MDCFRDTAPLFSAAALGGLLNIGLPPTSSWDEEGEEEVGEEESDDDDDEGEV